MRQRWIALLLTTSACIGQIAGEVEPIDDGTGYPPGGPADPIDPGNFTPPGTMPGPDGVPVFSCNSAAPALSGGPMRRLTAVQYRNTLRDLLVFAVGEAEGKALIEAPALVTALAQLPGDYRPQTPQEPHGTFRRLDQALDQAHVDAYFAAARAAGTALAAPARLATLVGPCAVDQDQGNDDACITSFIQRFGGLALRRPLTPADVAFYRGYYTPSAGIDAEGLADVIAGMLLAPAFLYVLEDGGEPGVTSGAPIKLTGHELAARLSYHFWQSMPDPQLTEAARTGELLTDAGYQTQVDRLFGDPRTRATLDSFFFEAFKLEDVATLGQSNTDPLYRAFAGPDLPGPGIRQAMIDEVMDLFRHYSWRQPSGIAAVLESDLSLTRDAGLARLYGTTAVAEGGSPQRFAPGERPGLLTRAAFLVNGSINTRPVMKGVFIRKALLCDDIPPPPGNANVTPPPPDSRRSTRAVVEAITEQPGTSCASCHKTAINPLGFVTEGYDALGRRRTEQLLFNETGTETARVPIDTTGVPQVVIGDLTRVSGPAEVARLIVRSGKAHACIARQYFRFSFGRWEDPRLDGCTLERLRQSIAGSGTLVDMFKQVALAPQFRQRTMQ